MNETVICLCEHFCVRFISSETTLRINTKLGKIDRCVDERRKEVVVVVVTSQLNKSCLKFAFLGKRIKKI